MLLINWGSNGGIKGGQIVSTHEIIGHALKPDIVL